MDSLASAARQGRLPGPCRGRTDLDRTANRRVLCQKRSPSADGAHSELCAGVQLCQIKHDKNFDLLVIPNAQHTSGGAYGDHKRYDYFVQHLLGVKPPEWKDLGAKSEPTRRRSSARRMNEATDSTRRHEVHEDATKKKRMLARRPWAGAGWAEGWGPVRTPV